jgi:AcrR family transcriptional regulator
MATADAPTDRPQRADARRNRERIVEAATAAFAESGLATQMDDIARRAGVGVGTVYRHFPTKDALVEALVEAHMAAMADTGRRLVEDPGDADPWTVFAGFLRTCAEGHLKDRALAEVLSTQPSSTFDEAARRTGLREAGGELLGRAREAGMARADASADDIALVMCGLGAVLRSWGKPAGERYMALVLDGFRAGCPSRLSDA